MAVSDLSEGASIASLRPVVVRTRVRMAGGKGPRKPNRETRAAVAALHAQGLSGAEIARQLGISKPTVCFHLCMLGMPPSGGGTYRGVVAATAVPAHLARHRIAPAASQQSPASTRDDSAGDKRSRSQRP